MKKKHRGHGHDPAQASADAGWHAVGQGRVTALDWATLLAGHQHIDPYLVWADATAFSGFSTIGGRPGDGTSLPFAVELASPELPAASEDAPCHALTRLEIPAVYYHPTADGQRGPLATRFVTAQVPLQALAGVLACSHVRRIQLGLPRIGVDKGPTASVAITTGETPRTVLGVIDDGCPFAHPALCDASGRTRVHFLWNQDSPPPAPDPDWKRPPRLGYGAELQVKALQRWSVDAWDHNDQSYAYQAANYGPVRLDPDLNGTQFRQTHAGQTLSLPVATMRARAHGAGVMHLAAGVARDPAGGPGLATPLRAQRAVASTSAQAPAVDDFARHWPLIFVQLPSRTVMDTSGGSLAVHVMDAIRYIIDRAECIPGTKEGETLEGSEGTANPRLRARRHQDNRVVINISYGATAGPHDGSSIAEQAMADLVAGDACPAIDRPRKATWICLAAGNAHGAQTHASLTLGPGQSGTFTWQIGPDNPHASFLEVWLPDTGVDGKHLPSLDARLDQLSVTLRPPAPLAPCTVKVGQAWVLPGGGKAPGGMPEAGIVFARRVAQGLRGTMVLLAVAPTRRRPGHGATAAHGRWHVDLVDGSAADACPPPIRVHAWAERGDLVYGTPRRQQSTVFGDESADLDGSFSFGSLSGIAVTEAGAFFERIEGPRGRVVVVGSHRLADGLLADYSSGGPDRHLGTNAPGTPSSLKAKPRTGPDATAPSDIGPALRGLRVAGMRGGEWTRMSGTSAAAPSVARLLANVQHALDHGVVVEANLRTWVTAQGLVPTGGTAQAPTPDPHRSGHWKLSPAG